MEKTYNAEAALQTNATEQEQATPREESKVASGVLSGDPEQKMNKQQEVYIGALMRVLHDKQTTPMVQEMLKAGPPEKTIPRITMEVNDMMQQTIARKGGQPADLETIFLGGVYVVSDLIEIGNAGGFFKVNDEGQVKEILQTTIQTYVERGLKDGSIDPVELQAITEPLMEDSDKEEGIAYAKKEGLSMQADQDVAMEAFGQKKYREGMLQQPVPGGR
jgi:hypothetical protein